MSKARRKYDAEFKQQTVKMVTEDHKSCRSVEEALGLPRAIVHRWVREAKADPQYCFRGQGHIKPSIADAGQLLKEVQQLRKERDILKKALAIFSRTHTRSINSSPPMQLI